jgi:hypothetical protein
MFEHIDPAIDTDKSRRAITIDATSSHPVAGTAIPCFHCAALVGTGYVLIITGNQLSGQYRLCQSICTFSSRRFS